MQRREFITLTGGAAARFFRPFAVARAAAGASSRRFLFFGSPEVARSLRA